MHNLYSKVQLYYLMLKRTLLFSGFLTLLSGFGHASVVVNNSSFETPDVAGAYQYNPIGGDWTFNGNSGIWSIAGFSETGGDGIQAGFVQQCNSGGCGGISPTPSGVSNFFQTLNGFTPGDTYSIGFWLAIRPGTFVEPVSVFIDAISLGDYAPVSAAFTQFTTSSFTATSSSMTLTFAGLVDLSGPVIPGGAEGDTAIDQVTVNATGSGVPEPNPAFLILLPLALLIPARRLLRT